MIPAFRSVFLRALPMAVTQKVFPQVLGGALLLVAGCETASDLARLPHSVPGPLTFSQEYDSFLSSAAFVLEGEGLGLDANLLLFR